MKTAMFLKFNYFRVIFSMIDCAVSLEWFYNWYCFRMWWRIIFFYGTWKWFFLFITKCESILWNFFIFYLRGNHFRRRLTILFNFLFNHLLNNLSRSLWALLHSKRLNVFILNACSNEIRWFLFPTCSILRLLFAFLTTIIRWHSLKRIILLYRCLLQIKKPKYFLDRELNWISGVSHVVNDHVQENLIIHKLMLELLYFHSEILDQSLALGFGDMVVMVRLGRKSRKGRVISLRNTWFNTN